MPDPPTPIIHPTATRAERFQRTNGVPAQTNGAGPPPRKPKLKKLRLGLVLLGLSTLALISTLFGIPGWAGLSAEDRHGVDQVADAHAPDQPAHREQNRAVGHPAQPLPRL